MAQRWRAGMLDSELDKLTRRAADAWVRESRASVHVITGNLKRSIRKEREGKNRYRVVADATNSTGGGYAAYEDGGTRYRPAHPFWRQGQRAAEDELKRGKL